MGKRKRDRHPAMWVATTGLPTAARHPFYRRLNEVLAAHGFDDFVEAECAGSMLRRWTVRGCRRGSTPAAADPLLRRHRRGARRLIALETHRAVFTWVLQCLGSAGLVKGKTIGIDATTLEAMP